MRDGENGFRGLLILILILILEFNFQIAAAELDPNKLPPPVSVTVNFDRDIKPIFEQSCFRCHGPEKPKSHFRLDNRESALKGGADNQDDIVPGDSTKSRLVYYVSGLVEDMQMPPPGKGQPLSAQQIGVLRAWIDQGAAWSSNAPIPTAFSMTPLLRWTGIHGDLAKFREIEGIKEGGTGGWEHFLLHDQLGPGETYTIEGHAIFRDQDYQVKFDLEKAEVGFVRAGIESWRKFYDDRGGFAPQLATNSFALNRDLSLGVGRQWIEFGLNRPDGLQGVIGYEHQFRNGSEATLQWGPVGTTPPLTPGSDARNIYPAFKDINENTHIIRLDASYDVADWHVGDNAQVEFYRLDTSRQNVLQDTFGPRPDALSNVGETYHHIQGANTISASKQFNDWLLVSSGYFYSRLGGAASLHQNTVDASGAPVTGDQWFANDISLSRESQVASIGSLLGPIAGLNLSLGAQGEWTRQETMGFENLVEGIPTVPPNPAGQSPITGNLDSTSARETAELRYTTIPWTILFAEARLRQEKLSRFEDQPGGATPFTYDATADNRSEEYRAGFNTSPWSRFSFGSDVKREERHTDYTHFELFNPAAYAYPGFFNWRDIDDRQIEARVVYRVTSWLRTSVNFRWQTTDYDNATQPYPLVTAGGPVEAGSYEARVYSFNATLTPLRKLYLLGTFSFSESRVAAVENGATYLAPWDGHTYEVEGSAAYALDAKTDLRATCSYSKSDYGQNNLAGLPLGIDYERYALQAGVTRRFRKNLTGNLAYGFFRYREPTSGNFSDYTAHSVFATVTMAWP